MTDDAMVVNPRGEVARGKAEIKAHLGAFLKGPAHGSIHKSRIIRIEFLTPDDAVVDGEDSISTPGLPEARPLTHRFTDIFVNDQGTWRIAHVRAYFLNGVTATNVEAAQQVAPAERSALPRRPSHR